MQPVTINFSDGFDVFITALSAIRDNFFIAIGDFQLPMLDLLIAFLIASLIIDLLTKGE